MVDKVNDDKYPIYSSCLKNDGITVYIVAINEVSSGNKIWSIVDEIVCELI